MTLTGKWLSACLVVLGFIGSAPYAEAASVTQSGHSNSGSASPTGFLALLENPRDSSSLRIDSDFFLRPNLSVGEATPVLPDPTKSWQAVQAKVWFHLPVRNASSKLFLQSGIGVLQADPLLPSQSLWAMQSLMVPVGVGMDYPTDTGRTLTTMFSLNLSDIKADSSTSAHVMPSLVFGIRF